MARKGETESLAERLEQLSYTDSTHMTIGVAESLVENNGFHGEHMAQTLSETRRLSHGVAMGQDLPGFSG
jgi:ADP-ribosylglycohydrolase